MAVDRIVGLVFLWLLTIAVAVMATRSLTQRPLSQPEQAPERVAGGAEETRSVPQDPRLATELRNLERENAELREKLARVQGEHRKLGNDYLSLVLRQALEDAVAGTASQGDMQAIWDKGFEDFTERHHRSLGAGLGRGVGLLFDMAQFGDSGVYFLRDVVTNRQLDSRERELALNVLSLMHTKTALRVIVDLREPDIMELDYPYDLILPQVAVLPTEDIAECVPDINRHIAHDLEVGDGGIAPEKTDLLAHLAFTHTNAESVQLLHTPEAMRENLSTALRIADRSHSPQARQYVEAVARQGTGQHRLQARRILQRW
jgi:hypothetical protein